MDAPAKLPKWAQGNSQVAKDYYASHAETWLDRPLRSVNCLIGVIIHGDLSQDQLQAKLSSFDIKKLLTKGPYDHSLLSVPAQRLISESLKIERVIDIHLHNLGYDEGNYLNPAISTRGKTSFGEYAKWLVIRYAAGMTDPSGSTEEARRRIHLYAHHFPKLQGFILPIHKAFQGDRADWKNTGNLLKNRSALRTAQTYQDSDSHLYSAASVHPGDPKWAHKLKKAHDQGIRLVKWMPPQGIQPDHSDYAPFYRAMADYGMVLIAHGGPEHALQVKAEWQDYGNPLRFRMPLQIGVHVIIAHCGHNDLMPDHDVQISQLLPGNELFARLAREAYSRNWPGKLFGDLAAVPAHYGPDFVRKLLEYSQEPAFRFIYGSDYPYTNLVKPGSDAFPLLAKSRLLDENLVEPLKQIRQWNPLLAYYICTRQLTCEIEHNRVRFPDATFTGQFSDISLVQLLKIGG